MWDQTKTVTRIGVQMLSRTAVEVAACPGGAGEEDKALLGKGSANVAQVQVPLKPQPT